MGFLSGVSKVRFVENYGIAEKYVFYSPNLKFLYIRALKGPLVPDHESSKLSLVFTTNTKYTVRLKKVQENLTTLVMWSSHQVTKEGTQKPQKHLSITFSPSSEIELAGANP